MLEAHFHPQDPKHSYDAQCCGASFEQAGPGVTIKQLLGLRPSGGSLNPSVPGVTITPRASKALLGPIMSGELQEKTVMNCTTDSNLVLREKIYK